MAEETNNNYGRIVYFEPNELFGDDNQPVNQEDLTKYVNLSVKVPSRFYKNNNNEFKQYDSILKGKPFFENDINGKEYAKFYLTDNYVNVYYTEFGKDGQINNGELFGIESIDISFDTQFQPIVVINFTDVKGLGLMSVMEYNYQTDKLKNLTAKSFFTSLFNFPYPIFTLEVKGYYGRSVSFDLSLKDFQTAFDSNTGNFKTTISFIGHLYGVYADIPMSFLLIAPYIDYQGDMDFNSSVELTGPVWNNITNLEKTNPNSEILPTFLGLLENYKNILSNNNLIGDSLETISTFQDELFKLTKLKKIKEYYEGLKTDCETITNGYGYYDGDTKYIGKNNSSDLDNKTLRDIPLSDAQNTNNLLFLTSAGERMEEKSNNYRLLKVEIDRGNFEKKYELQWEDYYISQGNADVVISPNQTSYWLYVFFDLNTKLENINREIEYIENYINGAEESTNDAIVSLFRDNIGFNPTIKNIYKLLFKHLNCFSDLFYYVITSVNENRTKQSLNLSNYDTDVPNFDNTENYGKIPPFPLFVDNIDNEKKIIYPGNIDNFKNQPEIILVENIYNSLKYASSLSIKNFYDIISFDNQTNSNLFNTNNYYSFFDDMFDSDEKHYNFLKHIENDKYSEYIRKIFIRRLSTYNRLHTATETKTIDLETFISNEVNLLYESNRNLSKDVLRSLEAFYHESLYDFYKANTGTTDTGYVGCSLDENNEAVLNNENLLILFKGKRYICEERINSYPINEEWKYIFPVKSLYFPNAISKGQYNQYKSQYFYALTNNERTKYLSCNEFLDTSSPSLIAGADWNVVKEIELIYVNDFGSFYSPDFNGELEYFNWACSQYSKKWEYFKHCDYGEIVTGSIPLPLTRSGVFGSVEEFKDSNYETITQNGKTLNKVVVLSIIDLLALGSIIYDRTTFVPVSFSLYINQYEDLIDGKYFYYCKNFSGHGCLDKILMGLYKSIYKPNEATEDDKKYCDYFQLTEKEIQDIKNGYIPSDAYYVIAKEFFAEHNNTNLTKDNVMYYYNSFLNSLFNKYGVPRNELDDAEEERKKNKEITELKCNIYYTLKTLYDKWFCGLDRNFFKLYGANGSVIENSEFDRIEYLTTTFSDISNDLIIDFEAFIKNLNFTTNVNNMGGKNVLSFMSKIAQDNQSSFLVLPTKIFNENLKEMFKPYSLYNGGIGHDPYGSTYIVMYNGDVSHYLDINGSEYEQDGFTIADYENGELKITQDANQVMNIASEVLGKHNYTVQAFGVTYGMQNQNFFKNISVDTQSPQITDYSIANMLTIANYGSDDMDISKTLVKTQTLYPVYANRSYNCTVEMMGCMNITPLMYFQLNNLPMFKGAYMIINVSHKITANDFITTFTGVRVSKYKIPINKQVLNISKIPIFNESPGITTINDEDNEVDNNSTIKASEKVYNTDYGDLTFTTVSENEEDWTPYEDPDCKLKGCWESAVRSARKILKRNNTCVINVASDDIGSPMNVVQLLYEKHDHETQYNDNGDYNLYYEETGNNRVDKYQYCVEYMKNEIGHDTDPAPVIVGVAHSVKRWNSDTGKWLNEGVTDHFICVYAYAEKDGKVFFKYFESGRNGQGDCVNKRNILVYDPNQGNPTFLNMNSTRNKNKEEHRRYDVSQIRIYGKHSDRLNSAIIVGPQKTYNQFTGDVVMVNRGASNRYNSQN